MSVMTAPAAKEISSGNKSAFAAGRATKSAFPPSASKPRHFHVGHNIVNPLRQCAQWPQPNARWTAMRSPTLR